MPHQMKPLACDPARVRGMSERLIVSHYENNYGGAVKRLNLIEEQLAGLDFATASGFLINGLKREELIATNSMILHELFFEGLGEDLHDRVQLSLGEHQVAHDHRLVTSRRMEGEPGAERQGRPDRDAVERDLQVRARQAEPADAARLPGGLPAEDLLDLLPVGLRMSGSGERQGENARRKHGAHRCLSQDRSHF